jgi:hypothetical protein
MLGPLWTGDWLNNSRVEGMVGLKLGERPSGVAASPIITFMNFRCADGGFKV